MTQPDPDLRDRIAEALYQDQQPPPVIPWKDELPLDREYFLRRADAVLAVLPAQRRWSDVTIVEGPQTVTHNANESTARPDMATRAGQNLRAAVLPAPDQRAAAHACDNCEGTDPGSCIANPNRPKPESRAAAALSQTERDMLLYALELAEEQALSRGDEFSEADVTALEKLRRLAGEAQQDPCGRPASMAATPCSAGDWCCKGPRETQQDETPAPASFVLWLDASDGSVPTHDGVRWPDGTATLHHRHFGYTTTHSAPDAARQAAHGKQGRIVWPTSEAQQDPAPGGDYAALKRAHVALAEQAGRDQAVLARIGQMADYWEKNLPEAIRTPAVVSAIRAALERAAVYPTAVARSGQPETDGEA